MSHAFSVQAFPRMYLLCGAALVVLFAVQVDAREPEPPDPIRPQMLEADEAMHGNTPPATDDVAAAERLAQVHRALRDQMQRIIVGQDEVVEQLLISLFAGGHCILEGVPGLAKTMMISTLAQCMNLKFTRIQFTPDLMPSDITGTEVIAEDKATGQRAFKFLPGPVFANVILADEINRTPPKTQAAMRWSKAWR